MATKGGADLRKARIKQDRRYMESVIFVPHTPMGVLKARIQRCEQALNFKTKVKVIEEMGRSLRETLCSAEPDHEGC